MNYCQNYIINQLYLKKKISISLQSHFRYIHISIQYLNHREI